MDETTKLVNTIVEALQDKKGKRIVIMNLSQLETAICKYFIICEGNTPIQTAALCDNVWDVVAERLHEKPMGAVGQREAQWIALDYGTVMLHIFVPGFREYYNLEALWADAEVNEIADIV